MEEKDCCKQGKCAECSGCHKINQVEPCSQYKCSCAIKERLEQAKSLSAAQEILEREMGIDFCDFHDLKNGTFYIKVDCRTFHTKYRQWFGNEWRKHEKEEPSSCSRSCFSCAKCK
jgi:hypothetical protein